MFPPAEGTRQSERKHRSPPTASVTMHRQSRCRKARHTKRAFLSNISYSLSNHRWPQRNKAFVTPVSSPRGGGRSHGLGCVGIGPISGFIAPDEKHLPGRGVATWVASPDGCVDYKPGSIQAWCVVYFGFDRDEVTQATVLVGGLAQLLWCRWASAFASGWRSTSLAWLAARTWRLLFFRPSTVAASLPRSYCPPTGYQRFTWIRDGHGPATDGAWPS